MEGHEHWKMFISQLAITLRQVRASLNLFVTVYEPLVPLCRPRQSHRLQLRGILVCRRVRVIETFIVFLHFVC